MTVHYYGCGITPCSIRNAAPLCASSMNGEKYNATAFLSARRDDARERSLIQRALKTLDRHLHEPGWPSPPPVRHENG